MRRILLGLVPAIPIAVLAGACGTQPVNLGVSMIAPQGLLDQATAVTLSVIDAAQAKCDAATGHVDKIPESALSFPLDDKDCPKGAAWCAQIQLDKDGTKKIFAVTATRAKNPIAEGCATYAVDRDPLFVDVQVRRYSAAPCCNDGKLEPGEQCDTGVVASCDPNVTPNACTGITEDSVCYCDCKAKEILLSVDEKAAPGLKNGVAGSKGALSLSFGPGSLNPGMLRAVYVDTDKNTSTVPDIHQSFLRQDLYPIADPVPLSYQLLFPIACNNVTNAIGTPLTQEAPAVAAASDDTAVVVYMTNEENSGPNFDIFLSPQNADGCTDTKPCKQDADCQTACDASSHRCKASVKLNTVIGKAADPHVAGSQGTALVVWSRPDGVFGRIWRTDGSTSPVSGEISIASGGSHPRVAAFSGGFRVVYQGSGMGDINGVFMRTISLNGALADEEQLVNLTIDGVQDQPDVAALDDGATLVVWHSGQDVYFQRFDGDGKAISPDDQSSPLNTTGAGDGTDQQNPAVAGASGFFTVVWETPSAQDPTLGNVMARFVGAKSGFGYNSVSGQNDDFPATDPSFATDRHHPAVAMSAQSGFVAVGWEDHDKMRSGIYVRRFPPPAQ